MTQPERCDWSGLRIAECAHCRDRDHMDDTEAIDVATPPPRQAKATSHQTARTRTRIGSPVRNAGNWPALCVNPWCNGDHGALPTNGRGNLCEFCEAAARDDLDVVADLWPDLREALTRQPPRQGDRVITTPSYGIRIDEATLNAMHTIGLTIAELGRVVVNERHAELPEDQATTPGTARWLARHHIRWLARHGDSGVSAQLAITAAKARHLTFTRVDPVEVHRVDLPTITCRERIGAETCGSPMHTFRIPATRGRPAKAPDIVCNAHPKTHRVPPEVYTGPKWASVIDPDAAATFARALALPIRHTTQTGD